MLILRDVLGFRPATSPGIMGSTQESVTSALKRARARSRSATQVPRRAPPAPDSAPERALIERLTRAYESGDIDELVALLTDDVLIGMPPAAPEYQGRDLVARFLAPSSSAGRRYRLVPTRANGQPAFGLYLPDRGPGSPTRTACWCSPWRGTRSAP